MAKCIQTYTTNIKKIICNQQERVVENYNYYWVWARVGPLKEKYLRLIQASYHGCGTPIGGYMPNFSFLALTEAALGGFKVLASQY